MILPPLRASARIRPRKASSALLVLAMVLAGVVLAAPAQAASAKPSRLKIVKVAASSAPSATGTSVAASVSVVNPARASQRAATLRLDLVSGSRAFRLGDVRVPALPGRGRTAVRLHQAAPQTVPAGRYAVRACFLGRPAKTCRKSAATVTVAPARPVAPAALVWDVGRLDFGARGYSDSVTRDVTITNRGGRATGAMAFTILGNQLREFSVAGSTCPTVLAAGASCRVTVRFEPGMAGLMRATLEASGAPGGSVALSGIGATRVLSMSTTKYSYGSAPINTSVTRTFWLANAGTVAVPLNPLAITGSGYVIDPASESTCVGLVALAPHGYCTFSMKFQPRAAGVYVGFVTATSGSDSTAIELRGTGELAPPT